MNFDIVSDLHIHDIVTLEHILHKMKKSKNKNLIVAGDTTDNVFSTIEIVEKFKKHYKNVFVNMGNHDHYMSSIKEIDDYLIKNNDNSIFHSNNRFQIIDDTVIIGFTGWYDLKCYEHLGFNFEQAKIVWENLKRDSKWINFQNDFMPWNYAYKEKQELKKLVKKFNDDDTIKNIIISTHMIPSRLFVTPKNNPMWDMATPSYVNSFMLEEILDVGSHKIKLWVYGHTHDRANFNSNDIRFINNARGYGKETNKWGLVSFSI